MRNYDNLQQNSQNVFLVKCSWPWPTSETAVNMTVAITKCYRKGKSGWTMASEEIDEDYGSNVRLYPTIISKSLI